MSERRSFRQCCFRHRAGFIRVTLAAVWALLGTMPVVGRAEPFTAPIPDQASETPGQPAATATPSPSAARQFTALLPFVQRDDPHDAGAVLFGGVVFRPDGRAVLRQDSDRLVAEGLDGPGRNGLRAMVGAEQGVTLAWEPTSFGAAPAEGESLELESFGSISEGAPEALSTVRLHTADNGIEVAVEFQAVDANRELAAQRLEVFSHGAMVARIRNQHDVSTWAATWPYQMDVIEGRRGQLPAARLWWSQTVTMTVGAETFGGDELRVVSEEPAQPAVLTSFGLWIAGRPRFELLEPIFWPLPIPSPCDEAAEYVEGVLVLPTNIASRVTPQAIDVHDELIGAVDDLYSDILDPDYDDEYDKLPCEPSIDAIEPTPGPTPDFDADLQSMGITMPADQVEATRAALTADLPGVTDLPSLDGATDLDGPLGAVIPMTKTQSLPFSGRDIIFVHGLQPDHLMDALSGVPHDGWKLNFGNQPPALANPEFFDVTGYWKRAANGYWGLHYSGSGVPTVGAGSHLNRLGVDNRFLIVAWPSTQRAPIAGHAMLTQIAQAMLTGEGVVNLKSPGDTSDFCRRPTCVIVSHSTGALVTEVAMWMAESGVVTSPLMQAIPSHVKAHVALHGAFSGSEYASLSMAVAAGLTSDPIMCKLAIKELSTLLGSPLPPSACSGFPLLFNSILLDLAPPVATTLWLPAKTSSQVPVIAIAGAHPTAVGDEHDSGLAALKYLFLSGFDDGTLNMDSQCAIPVSPIGWPSRYVKIPLKSSFDFGLPFNRALRYFIDQTVPSTYLTPAASCVPYLSPVGMLQPVVPGTSLLALMRYPNHHTFIQSASDHLTGPQYPNANRLYPDGPGSDHNWEEERVIVHPLLGQSVYAPDLRFPVSDPMPLVSHGLVIEETISGKYIQVPVIKKWKLTWKKLWIWKRRYFRPSDSAAKDELDYLYRSTLLRLP